MKLYRVKDLVRGALTYTYTTLKSKYKFKKLYKNDSRFQ